MAGQRQKAREELVNQRGNRTAVVGDVPAGDRLVMPMPEGLLKETQEIWRLHMTDVRHLGEKDFGHVLTWIHSWDDYLVCRKQLLGLDSRLQSQKYGVTMHPLVRMMVNHRTEIAKLELALGFNPQARMRLGITFAAEMTALDKLRGRGERRPPAAIGASV